MIIEEKNALKKVVNDPNGLLSDSIYNVYCYQNMALRNKLVTLGYVEEISRQKITGKGEVLQFRATEKGRSIFYPLPKKLWYWFKGDLRTIIVATIISIITTLFTLLIKSLL